MMALDIKDINEEKAFITEQKNEYSASLKRIKKERDEAIDEFELEVTKFQTKHKGEIYVLQCQLEDCLHQIEVL